MAETITKETFTIVCAWCEKILNNNANKNSRQTHTICRECLDNLKEEIHLARSKPSIKNSLPISN